MQRTHLFRLFAVLAIASLLLGAPGSALMPAAQAQDAAPAAALVTMDPAQGAAWPGGDVVFTFDRPVTVENFSITPDIAGNVEAEGERVRFVPLAAPIPGERFRFRFDARAEGAAPTAVDATLTGLEPLAVTAVQPGDGAAEVDTDSRIVVSFNRPVVPLTGAGAQADLPQPLTIDPHVAGQGEWLTTSVYAFTPDPAFAGATAYTVSVDEDIAGLQGEAMDGPYTFSFSTAAPVVVDSQPTGNQVRPRAPVQVFFSQPMDPASSEAAFSLSGPAGFVAGDFGWDASGRTLWFTPTQPLDFGASYTLAVARGAQPAGRQGTLRDGWQRQFKVVETPRVVRTSPADGAQEVAPDASVVILFASPLSRTLVVENVSVSTLPTTTTVYSYYNEWDNTFQLDFVKQPRTTYTVTVGAGVGDDYGNTLGEEHTFSFTTGDYPPFVRIDLDRYTHFTAITPTLASVLYRNMADLEVELYTMPVEEVLKLNGPNQWEFWQNYTLPDAQANLVWSRTYTATQTVNESYRRVVKLDDGAGGVLAPGFYLLQVKNPPQPPPTNGDVTRPYEQAIVLISNNNLVLKKSYTGQSLVWLTDVMTGEPVAGRDFTFYSAQQPAGQTTTGDDGVGLAELSLADDFRYLAVVAVSGEPGDPDFAAATSDWSTGIAPWDFNISGGWISDDYQTFFYTERPIYRPGNAVHWKGIVRQRQGETLVLPPEGLVMQVAARNDRGDTIFEQEIPIGPMGTLSGTLELAPDAPTGFYYLEARLDLSETRQVYGGVGFQVAEYRKPEFAITVTPEQEEYVQGDVITVTVQANYYSGEALGNAPVTWRVFAEPHFFAWDDAPEGTWYSFTPYDPEQTRYDPFAGSPYYGMVSEGVGKTNPDGSFVISLPADLGSALQSQNWVFDVTIQSPTNAFVYGTGRVPVHRGAYYVGLAAQNYVGAAGAESLIDAVTVSPQGERVGGVELDVNAYEFKWNSVWEQGADGRFVWNTSVERTPVFTGTVTTDAQGEAEIAFTPPRGGQYQIVATGRDAAGNRISSAMFLWAAAESADAFTAWPRENHDRIELVADKREYAPGDTARVLVPSPFAGPVQALVTIERAGVIEQEVRTLESNSTLLEVPISEAHIPNVFVGVVIVKGIDETNPTAAIRVGYVQLSVDRAAKQLTIDVATSADASDAPPAPGQTITYTLTVRDSAGEPVEGAEVSVGIVDKALYALAMENTGTLIDTFYQQQPLGVSTGATLIINRDRMSQQLSEGAKGGGGGGGGGLEVREEFPDTAFWHAAFVSDENGEIVFALDLPDNLTTWRLTARGITADTRVGDASSELAVTKELQVRPLLPRFFTAGDRATVGAVIVNATDAPLEETEVTVSVSGATLEQGADEAGFTLAPIAPGESATVDLPVEVGSLASSVVFTMTAQAQGADRTLADAVRMVLPVNRYSTPEVVGTSGQVEAGGSVVESIVVPQEATDEGELLVQVEPSLAAGLIEGLEFLKFYPYECNEQVVSRFLPNLMTAGALRTLDQPDAALEAELELQIGAAVQKLTGRQNPDGGWGYWPGEESRRFISAYVLWGLGVAEGMGYPVPERTLDRAVEFLDRSFQAPGDLKENWQVNELAFIHFVLAELGDADPGRMSTLYDARERLQDYGRSWLAMAMQRVDPADPRLQTLLADLTGAAEVSASGTWWSEPSVHYWTLNTDTRTTAIVLEAITRLDPQNPLLPGAVRRLMDVREAGVWSSTQENAWSIMALTDWMAATGELEGDYNWDAALNDAELGSGAVTPETVRAPEQLRVAVADMLRDMPNTLRLARTEGPGALYYTAHLRYFLDALDVEPLDRGIVVDRRFDVAGETVDTAAVGDVISVTATIVAPQALHQVRVDVPIPAGTEVIDPSLGISPQFDEAGNPIYVYEWDKWTPTYRDFRDDKVSLFATYLPAGTYQYTFKLRATVPGEYRVLPVYGEMMYFTEVWGRGGGELFTVTAAEE